jgi:peptide chain release factor
MMRTIVITAGRGPVECRRAVKAVAAAFIAEAGEAGLDVDLVAGDAPDGEGPVSVRLLLEDEGRDLGLFLAGWLGSVQWIARSERRSKADRKNWFVGVFEEPQTSGDAPRVAEADITFSAITAGGPGGQHQNKTASAIRGTHRPTGVSVVVRAERSQHRNKAIAIARIEAVLATMRRMEQSRAERSAWELKVEVQRGGAVRVIRG